MLTTFFDKRFLALAYLNKGYAYWEKGEYAPALRMFKSVRVLSPQDAEAAYCIKEILKDMIRPIEFAGAAAVHPNRDAPLWEVRLEKGWDAFHRGDYAAAYTELSRSVQMLQHMAEKSLQSILPCFDRMNEARFLLAQTCVRLSRIPEACFLFASISPSSPFYPFAQQQLSRLKPET